MYIRSIEPRDRDYLPQPQRGVLPLFRLRPCNPAAERRAHVRTAAARHALRGLPDRGGRLEHACAYLLLALTWSNEAGGLCVWLDELMVDETVRQHGHRPQNDRCRTRKIQQRRALPAGGDRKQCARRRAVPDARLRGAGLPPDDYGHAGRPVSRTEPQFKAAAFSLPSYLL